MIEKDLCNCRKVSVQNVGLLKLKPKSRIVAGEMKFIRKSLGYKLRGYKTNTEISGKLKITSVIKNIN
jgi:hypothetical protein